MVAQVCDQHQGRGDRRIILSLVHIVGSRPVRVRLKPCHTKSKALNTLLLYMLVILNSLKFYKKMTYCYTGWFSDSFI